MYTVLPARAWWPAVGAPLERGVRHQFARKASQGVFACAPLWVPLRAAGRAVAVPRVCGACRGFCMALCALQGGPPREPLATTPCRCLKRPTANHRIGPQCLDFVPLLSEQPVLTFCSARPSADRTPRSARRQPFAAYGGFLVCLDWPALTPALTEIRLFVPFGCFAAARQRTALNGEPRLGLVVAVQLTPAGALSAGVPHGVFSDA